MHQRADLVRVTPDTRPRHIWGSPLFVDVSEMARAKEGFRFSGRLTAKASQGNEISERLAVVGPFRWADYVPF